MKMKICCVCKTGIQDESQRIEIADLIREIPRIYSLRSAHLDCWHKLKARNEKWERKMTEEELTELEVTAGQLVKSALVLDQKSPVWSKKLRNFASEIQDQIDRVEGKCDDDGIPL